MCLSLVNLDEEITEREAIHKTNLERLDVVLKELEVSPKKEELQKSLHQSLPNDLVQRVTESKNENSTLLFDTYRYNTNCFSFGLWP